MFASALAASLLLGSFQADGGQPATADLASYRQERARAGRDAASQVKLALWCEANGLDAERIEHLAIAVMTDPANAAARGLLGLVSDSGKWRKPEDVAAKIQADAKVSAALADYADRRAKAPKTAEGHWRLALWCEENGLKPEATAHLTACVRLDPARSAAWKRLGCKKVGGRWLSDAQIAASKADARAQLEADRRYAPLLGSWRAGLRDRDANKRFDAEKNLNSLKDPRAAKSVWGVFVLGAQTPADLNRAVQLLGQLDAPLASRGLAMIALDAIDPEVRRAAMETLARRDPRDYMGDLIALLRDELKWEVRPVGGPGSLGVLFVEGQEFRRTRIYAPPAMNFVYNDSSGSWNTDSDGFEVLRVPGANSSTTVSKGIYATFTGAELRHGVKPGDPRAAQLSAALGPDPYAMRRELPNRLFKEGWGNGGWLRDNDFNVALTSSETTIRATEDEIPIGRIVNEYRKSAVVAEAQLEQDTAAVKRENDGIKARNAQVVDILNGITNQTMPPLGRMWKSWWADQRGYAFVEPPALPKQEVVENVPLAYLPQQVGGGQHSTRGIIGTHSDQAAGAYLTPTGLRHAAQAGLLADCFAAGTPVRTRLGVRPIEALEVGDSVLAQDMATGALGYKPVLAVFKFRPAETLNVTFGQETLRTTGVHRFWRIGEGWVMARDLKPGDVVRTLGGSAKVEAVANDVVRPVFNLEVAESRDYFVGRAGVLAGDNTLQNERVSPFDAPAARTNLR